MSKKRRREQPAVDSHLVEIYEDLASVHEDVRLKAANTLLTNFVADGKSSGDQLIEILRRLIRGLCSGRKAARLGFSVALTEFLTIFFGPRRWNVPEFQNVSQLIETLRKQTHSGSNVSSQVRTRLDLSAVPILICGSKGGPRSSVWTTLRSRCDH